MKLFFFQNEKNRILEFCGQQTPDSSPHGSPFNNTDRLTYHAQLNANGSNVATQPTSAGHLLNQQLHNLNNLNHAQMNHQDNQISQQLHTQPNQQSILGQQLHQSTLLNNCASPHSGHTTYNGSTGQVSQANNLLMDATRSLPTPEMSPPENGAEKEHYLHLYGHQNSRFNQASLSNVQQSNSNSNSQTGSAQLYQIINNQVRHSPGALSTSSACSTNNSSTNNSTAYSASEQSSSNRTNDNPVTELISKFSPNSSSFLKNVCPPFQRSTPQASPTPPNYDQQLTVHHARYYQPVIDQSQLYSAKRTAYAYNENGQLTWSVYDQQQPQAYAMIKPNENYGSDQLINSNEIYADYYIEHQQYAEQMMNPNDYLHGGHLTQAQQVQQHQLSGVQSQQIAMMQQYGVVREDSSFINALTEAQETISS